MATRAKEFAKTTATVLGIAGLALGGIAGLVAAAASAHFLMLFIPYILLGAAVSGIAGAIQGGVLGAVIGLFFRKKQADVNNDNQPAVKLGRSAQMQAPGPVREQIQETEQTTTFRDMVSSRGAAVTNQQSR